MRTNEYLTDLKKQQKLLAEYLTSIGVEASEADLLNVLIQKIYTGGIVMVDQEYNPKSPNAQSGIATAGAVGVANDYTDKAIKSLKTYANNTFAPAIKNTVSGSVLAVHDVSPVEHDLGVNVRSKNLLPYPYYQNSSSANGGTFTVNDDCSITASGIPTAYVELKLYSGESLVKSGKITYRTSGSITNVTTDFVGFDCENNVVFSLWIYESNPLTIDLDSYDTEVTKWAISVKRNASNTEMSGTFYPMLELGTTATDYTPYVADLSAVGVSRYGKNLFNLEPMLSAQNWKKDSALKVQDYWNYPITGLSPNTEYTLSMSENGWSGVSGNGLYVTLRNNVGTFAETGGLCHDNGHGYNCKSKVTITSNENGMLYLSFYNPTDERLALFFSRCPEMILAVGSSAVSYEPYKEPQTATANADGTVEGLTSLSPNITVTTDTDGVVIDMTYNADTKMYIDNKLAEISTAIVNNV